MKAIIIFAIAVLLLVSCEKEQPTKVTQEVTFDKHTIHNDSNWVEITDIKLLESEFCLCGQLVEWGYIFYDDTDYQELRQKSITDSNYCMEFMTYWGCGKDSLYDKTNIDYSNYSAFGFYLPTNYNDSYGFKVYKHKNSDNYAFIIDVHFINVNANLDPLWFYYRIPKINKNSIIKVDSTMTYVG